MKTIVIVGAGPGLGMSIVKKFGKEGYKVALIARNENKLKNMMVELESLGITSKIYTVDIMNTQVFSNTLKKIEGEFGRIDIVEFSPYSGTEEFKNVLELTTEDIEHEYQKYIQSAITIVSNVTKGMKKRGSGAILFTNGISGIYPMPQLGNIGIVSAGLRNYANNLHNELKNSGIYIGFMSIAAKVQKNTKADPQFIANKWYDMYQKQDVFESVFPE